MLYKTLVNAEKLGLKREDDNTLYVNAENWGLKLDDDNRLYVK